MIPTAKEFIKNMQKEQGVQEYTLVYEIDVPKKMIEFTKLHVTAALKAVLEDSPTGSSTNIPSYEDMENAIVNSYPLSLIK